MTVCAFLLLAATAVDPLSSDVNLCGRAERDNWGVPTMFGRKGSAAVVHPPVRAPEADVFSLNGPWTLLTDEKSIPYGAKPWQLDAAGGLPTRLRDEAAWQKFLTVGAYHREGKGAPRTVEVPGFWEPQGVGEPGIGRYWDSPDRGDVRFARVFSGAALMRRTFDAPARWTGRRLWLKVGGVLNTAYFWINAKPAAFVRQSCGSYKFDVTDLITPGKPFGIVALVHTDGPSKFGGQNSLHHLSGFYRDLEIEATDDAWLDDVWCRGDAEKKTAEIHVSLRGVRADETLSVAVELGEGRAVRELATGEDAVLELPLPGGRLWSPESPNLHTAKVSVARGGTVVGTWWERFGVRRLEVRGKEFYLNGRPFFVRGCGEHNRDPLTYVAEAKTDGLRRRMAIMRRAGFNQSRHHTHCPAPEYFSAADETGHLVEPELPYACGGPNENIPFSPLWDLQELVRHYRRHPSFAMVSMGNEGHMASCDADLYRWMKANDPDRLVVHNDGGHNTSANSDFFTGPEREWEGSRTNAPRPFVAHEYLNIGIKEDPRNTDRFTGLMPAPRPWSEFDAGLARAGLDRTWGLRCTDASQRLQAFYEKRGIEKARRDPACSGYSFWSMTDVGFSTTGPAVAQGFLNCFWEPKHAGLSPEAFAAFNSPDALLLAPSDPAFVRVAGTRYRAEVVLSAYGERDLVGTEIAWRLATSKETLAEGRAPLTGPIAPGAARTVAALDFELPQVRRPVKATLTLSFDSVANGWELWIFPERKRRDGAHLAVDDSFFAAFTNLYDNVAVLGTPAAVGRAVRVLPWSEQTPAAEKGQRTLFLSQTDGKPNVELGWWWLGDQIGTAFADHPAFGDLPHEGSLSPLFFRIMKHGRKLPFAPVSADKLLAVGEGREDYFLYLGGDSETLYAFGLDLLAPYPEAAALLDGLFDYGRMGD